MTAQSTVPNEIWDDILKKTDLRPIVPSKIDSTGLYSWNAQRLDLVRKTFSAYLAKDLHPHKGLKAGVLCGMEDLFMSLDENGQPSTTNVTRLDNVRVYPNQYPERIEAFKKSRYNDLTTLILPLLETAIDDKIASIVALQRTLRFINMMSGRTNEEGDWSGLLPRLKSIALDKRITNHAAPTTEGEWSYESEQFMVILDQAAEMANSKLGCGVTVNLGKKTISIWPGEATAPRKLTWFAQSLDIPDWAMDTAMAIDHVFSLDLTTRSSDYRRRPDHAAHGTTF